MHRGAKLAAAKSKLQRFQKARFVTAGSYGSQTNLYEGSLSEANASPLTSYEGTPRLSDAPEPTYYGSAPDDAPEHDYPTLSGFSRSAAPSPRQAPLEPLSGPQDPARATATSQEYHRYQSTESSYGGESVPRNESATEISIESTTATRLKLPPRPRSQSPTRRDPPAKSPAMAYASESEPAPVPVPGPTPYSPERRPEEHLTSVQAHNTYLSVINADLESESSEKTAHIRRLEQSIVQLSAEQQTASERILDMAAELVQLRNDLAEAHRTVEVQQESLQQLSAQQQRILELEESISASAAERLDLESQLQERWTLIQDMEAELDQLRSAVQTTQTLSEDADRNKINMELTNEELATANAALEYEVESLKSQIKEIQARDSAALSNYEDSLQQSHTKYDELQARYDDLQAKCDGLQSQQILQQDLALELAAAQSNEAQLEKLQSLEAKLHEADARHTHELRRNAALLDEKQTTQQQLQEFGNKLLDLLADSSHTYSEKSFQAYHLLQQYLSERGLEVTAALWTVPLPAESDSANASKRIEVLEHEAAQQSQTIARLEDTAGEVHVLREQIDALTYENKTLSAHLSIESQKRLESEIYNQSLLSDLEQLRQPHTSLAPRAAPEPTRAPSPIAQGDWGIDDDLDALLSDEGAADHSTNVDHPEESALSVEPRAESSSQLNDQLRQLREQVIALEKSNATFALEGERAAQQLARERQLLEDADRDRRSANEKQMRLQEESWSLQQQVESLDTHCREMRSQLETQGANLAQSQKELARVRALLRTQSEQATAHDGYQEQIVQYEAKLTESTIKIEDLESEIARIDAVLVEVQALNESLERQLEQEQTERESATNKANKIKADMWELEQKVAQDSAVLIESLHELTDANSKMKAQIKSYREEVERLKQSIQSHQTEHAETHASSAEEVERLNTVVAGLRETIKEKLADIAHLESENESLATAGAEVTAQLGVLRGQLRDIEASHNTALLQLEEAQAEVAGLRDDNETLRLAGIEVTEKLSALREQFEQSNEERQHIAQLYETLRASLVQTEDQTKILEQAGIEVSEQLKTVREEATYIRQERDEAIGELSQHRERLAELEIENSTLRLSGIEVTDQLTVLRDALTGSEDQCAKLVEQLNETAQSLSVLGGEKDHLCAEVDDLTHQLELLREQALISQSSQSEIALRIAELQAKIDALESENAALHAANADTAAQLAIATNERNDVIGQLEDAHSMLHDLESKNEALQSAGIEITEQLDSLRRELLSSEEQNEAVVAECERLRLASEAISKELLDKDVVIADLSSKIQHLQESYDLLEHEYRQKIDHVETIDRQNQGMHFEREDLQAQLQVAQQSVHSLEEHIHELEAERSRLAAEAADVRQILSAATSENDQLQKHIEEREHTVTDLRNHLESLHLQSVGDTERTHALELEREELSAQLHDAQERLERYILETEAVVEQHRTEAAQHSDERSRALSMLEQTQQDRDDTIAEYQQHAKDLEGQIDRLNQELHAIKDTMGATEQLLAAKVASLEQEVSDVRNDGDHHRAHAEELSAALEAADQALQQLQGESVKWQGERDALIRQLADLDDQLTKSSALCDELSFERDRLESELHVIRSTSENDKIQQAQILTSLESEHRALSTQVTELLDRNSQLVVQNEQQHSVIEELQHERDHLAGHIEESEDKIRVLHETKGHVESEVSELASRMAYNDGQVQELQTQIEILMQEKLHAENLAASLQVKLEGVEGSFADNMHKVNDELHRTLEDKIVLRDSLSRVESDLLMLRQSFAQLEQERDHLRDYAVPDLSHQLESQYSLLTQERQSILIALEQLGAVIPSDISGYDIDAIHVAISTVHQVVVEQAQQLEATYQELGQLRDDSLSKEADLRAQLEYVQARYEEITSSSNLSAHALRDVEAQLAAAKQSNSILEKQTSEYKSEHKRALDAELTVSQLRQELQELRAQYSGSQAQTQDLQQSLAQLRTEYDETHKLLELSNEKIRRLQGIVDVFKLKERDYILTIKSLSAADASVPSPNRSQYLLELDERLKQEESALQEQERQIVATESELVTEQQKSQQRDLIKKIDAIDARLSPRSSKPHQLDSAQIAALEHQISLLRNELTVQSRDADDAKERYEAELKGANERVQNYFDLSESSTKSMEVYRQELRKCRERLAATETELLKLRGASMGVHGDAVPDASSSDQLYSALARAEETQEAIGQILSLAQTKVNSSVLSHNSPALPSVAVLQNVVLELHRLISSTERHVMTIKQSASQAGYETLSNGSDPLSSIQESVEHHKRVAATLEALLKLYPVEELEKLHAGEEYQVLIPAVELDPSRFSSREEVLRGAYVGISPGHAEISLYALGREDYIRLISESAHLGLYQFQAEQAWALLDEHRTEIAALRTAIEAYIAIEEPRYSGSHTPLQKLQMQLDEVFKLWIHELDANGHLRLLISKIQAEGIAAVAQNRTRISQLCTMIDKLILLLKLSDEESQAYKSSNEQIQQKYDQLNAQFLELQEHTMGMDEMHNEEVVAINKVVAVLEQERDRLSADLSRTKEHYEATAADLERQKTELEASLEGMEAKFELLLQEAEQKTRRAEIDANDDRVEELTREKLKVEASLKSASLQWTTEREQLLTKILKAEQQAGTLADQKTELEERFQQKIQILTEELKDYQRLLERKDQLWKEDLQSLEQKLARSESSWVAERKALTDELVKTKERAPTADWRMSEQEASWLQDRKILISELTKARDDAAIQMASLAEEKDAHIRALHLDKETIEKELILRDNRIRHLEFQLRDLTPSGSLITVQEANYRMEELHQELQNSFGQIRKLQFQLAGAIDGRRMAEAQSKVERDRAVRLATKLELAERRTAFSSQEGYKMRYEGPREDLHLLLDTLQSELSAEKQQSTNLVGVINKIFSKVVDRSLISSDQRGHVQIDLARFQDECILLSQEILYLRSLVNKLLLWRADLKFQKLYLTLKIDDLMRSEKATLEYLKTIGIAQVDQDGSLPLTPRVKLRRCIYMVIAIIRMRSLAQGWQHTVNESASVFYTDMPSLTDLAKDEDPAGRAAGREGAVSGYSSFGETWRSPSGSQPSRPDAYALNGTPRRHQ
ncbi:uncharacterized protein BJ171DRAFT_168076 [Polychytrium aggregatum]|uniref:uncharacterized protein n=1 Tax=Polychytrium aggregatum TaxID=110093 RepID=UPI0022FF2B1D|nr:uncharacterized protein BJ171DRAFT_168076 [Polychytrium aggregatum]KAI9208785.1 hypothetical protein BJ171DRAFT_168076 [Polychytrium aggregatum]